MSVVVGYADRPECERALEAGALQARLQDLPLHIVHVAKVGAGQEDNESILRYREQLQRFKDRYQEQGLKVEADEVFARDRVSEAFLEELSSRNATLAVIGIRSRSAVGKLLVGSVAQDIIMTAPCPVLSVKP